ncbi:MAG: hypothetical protein US49_C0007G0042 [candidate division TM6 bacterium GW2011_GWF2_37_49]|nr:MAG: hypothetical protein US49_C0007G0042 [candidate division TM6 bacterium GW2011_GWF2_37_49]
MKSIKKSLFLLSFLTSLFSNQLPAMNTIAPQIIKAHYQGMEYSDDLITIISPCKRFKFVLDYKYERVSVLYEKLNLDESTTDVKLCWISLDIGAAAQIHANPCGHSDNFVFITVWNKSTDIVATDTNDDRRLQILLFDAVNGTLSEVLTLGYPILPDEEILGADIVYPVLALKTSKREFELMFELPNLLFA